MVIDRDNESELDEAADVVHVVQVFVPCRSFLVEFEVLVGRRLPIVDEFVLRLLKIADSLDSTVLAAFFGLSERESTVVFQDLMNQQLLEFSEGGDLQLSAKALRIFGDASASDIVPRIQEVSQRTEEFSIDLITFEPAAFQPVKRLEFGLELNVAGHPTSGVVEERARKTFETRFHERARKQFGQGDSQRSDESLYRVRKLVVRSRYLMPAPIRYRMHTEGELRIEPDFSLIGDEIDIERRVDLLNAIRDAVRNLPSSTPATYWPAIASITGMPKSRFPSENDMTPSGLSMWTQSVEKSDEFPGSAFYGHLGLERNLTKLNGHLRAALRRRGLAATRAGSKRPYCVDWMPPTDEILWLSNFGTARSIDVIRDAFKRASQSLELHLLVQQPFDGKSTLLNRKGLREEFLSAGYVSSRPELAGVEVILLPDEFACVMAAYRRTDSCQAPLWLGLMTSNPEAVRKMASRLKQLSSFDKTSMIWGQRSRAIWAENVTHRSKS